LRSETQAPRQVRAPRSAWVPADPGGPKHFNYKPTGSSVRDDVGCSAKTPSVLAVPYSEKDIGSLDYRNAGCQKCGFGRLWVWQRGHVIGCSQKLAKMPSSRICLEARLIPVGGKHNFESSTSLKKLLSKKLICARGKASCSYEGNCFAEMATKLKPGGICGLGRKLLMARYAEPQIRCSFARRQ
jgi:hypothetical protein